MTSADPIERARIAPAIGLEFPHLSALALAIGSVPGRSPRGLLDELAIASGRIRGADAVSAAAGSVAARYRSLRRELGMDPDAPAAGIEAVTRRRLVEGGLRTAGALEDSICLATIEFAVPLLAVAAGAIEDGFDLAVSTGEDPLFPVGEVVLGFPNGGQSPLFGPVPKGLVPDPVEGAAIIAIGCAGVEQGWCEAALARVRDLAVGMA